MWRLIFTAILCVSCGIPRQAVQDLTITCEELQKQAAPISQDVMLHDARFDDIPADPKQALEFCESDLRAKGFIIREKPNFMDGQFARYSTTLPLSVWLGEGFREKPIANQAITMCHERVHAYTEMRFGIQKSFDTYVTAAGRLGMETPSYYVGWKVAEKLGFSAEYLERMKARVARSLHRDYALRMVTEKCIYDFLGTQWK